jgi:hypothetical protein
VKEARAVYGSLSRFGADALLDDADRVCEFCCVARLETGEWERLMSVDQRSYNLSQSGTKSKAEYRDKLTAGSLPTSGSDSSDDETNIKDTGKSW